MAGCSLLFSDGLPFATVEVLLIVNSRKGTVMGSSSDFHPASIPKMERSFSFEKHN